MALLGLLFWLFLPVYLAQGAWLRATVDRLAPAPGPKTGQAPAPPGGSRDALRLLVIGESSVAGVGLDSTAEAMPAHLASAMAGRLACRVSWRAAGFNSATAGALTRAVMPNLPAGGYDLVVLALGTNDVKNLVTASRFKRDYGELIYAVTARWPDARVLISGIGPIGNCPAFPWPFRTLIGWRARILRGVQIRLARERGVDWVAIPFSRQRDQFCADGFHPSDRGSRWWAVTLADRATELMGGGLPGDGAALHA